MRKDTRINNQFLEDQENRRKALQDSDENGQNSIQELRDRITAVEKSISMRG